MRKTVLKSILGCIAVCFLIIGFLYVNNDIGVAMSGLEDDVRSSSKIKEDWVVEGDVSDTMAAYISYAPDKTDHSFSVYVNRPGFSFGYFFRGGGNIIYLTEFTVKGYNERAFISMNHENVERIEIDNGDGVQVIDIDSNKPFAVVLPVNAGNVIFYDIQGQAVEYSKNRL